MTTVVTSEQGSATKPVGVLYIPPDCQVPDAGSDTALSATGLDPAFLADVLSACLAHERCGVHLYRSVAQRSQEPSLVEQYRHFGDETMQHVHRLEELISSSGGNPAYVSPAARATEKAASALLESTFLLEGSLDPETAELTMLEAVMLAEAKDLANWEVLAELAAQMNEGPVREQLAAASAEVLAQEVEHHGWASTTRATMLITRAGATPMSGAEAAQLSVNGASKAELYEAAQELGVEGRSTMTKDELAHAVAEKGGRS